MKKFLLTLTTLMTVGGTAVAAPLYVHQAPGLIVRTGWHEVVARPILPAPIATVYLPPAPVVVATVPAERIVYRRPVVLAHRPPVIVARPRVVF